MNILVTGANGQLGRSLQQVAFSEDHYIFTDVCEDYPSFDITNLEEVRRMVKENQVGCIVNCAAWTDVDHAETAGEIVERLNAEGPENLAIAMKEVGGLLVHISTDYVFGGKKHNTPCREDQQGTPTGVYGLTKFHGEQRIIATGVDHVIIRTAWLYSEYGRNFLKTMLRLTSEREQVRVVMDQVGTPTYALDLACAIVKILSERRYEGHTGIYHYSDEGVCSWYDFAVEIARLSGHTECEVLPCRSEEFPSPVVRPAYSVLDKTKIKETFGVRVPYWRSSLAECIKNME